MGAQPCICKSLCSDRKVERLRKGLTGKCNVRWACDPSSHRFRQGGLDFITFNFPPAITFPVDHFAPQVNVYVRVRLGECV